jgi:nucleoside-diphosphate-sugar epimerase
MRAMVTGGTGLLGSHIVERLVAQGYEVWALARKTSDLSHLKTSGAEIIFGDVEAYDSLPPAVSGVDVVFHAAARAMPGWGSWQQFEASIMKGTENLLRASAEAGVPRFLHVSSGSVYGKACQGDTPASESTPCEVDFTPDTYYDCAKVQAEKIAFDYHNQGRVQVSIVRPGGIYGPRDRVFCQGLFRLLSMPIVMWPGESNPRLSAVFASDAADCAILAGTKERAAGQVYNVAPPKDIRVRDFANALLQAMGKSKPQMKIPYSVGYAASALIEAWARLRRVKEMPSATRSLIGFMNKGVYLDGSKAKEELGWEPKVPIEEGTRLYIQWRRSQAKK